jgi:hypothetical protein
MIKEMHQMLVAMLARLDQFLGNPTGLDQTVGNQSCGPTKSSQNQGEMERSNNQTKHGPMNSRCVISPKASKPDSSCFDDKEGSQKNKKVPVSRCVCCEKLEEYRCCKIEKARIM